MEDKRRCRLSDEEVRMAKELGFQPKSLIKNIPSPSQQWKAPVNQWVRDLEPKVILFDRAAGFLVHPPQKDVKPTRIVRRTAQDHEEWDDDVLF